MPTDEFTLQGFCVSCRRVFPVKHFENICQECEHKKIEPRLPKVDKGNCSTCRFYVSPQCRKAAPAFGWPEVSKYGWCGEHQAIDTLDMTGISSV